MPWSILPALSTNYNDVSGPSRPGPLQVLFLPPGMLAQFYTATHSLDFSSQSLPAPPQQAPPYTVIIQLPHGAPHSEMLLLTCRSHLLSTYPRLLTEQLGVGFIFQLVQVAEHLKCVLF